MRTDSFPSIIGVRNAKTKERNPDADLDEVIAKILDEPNRNSIGPGLLGWTKCAHEGRMRTYGRPETLLLGIPENENNVGAHPTLMRAIMPPSFETQNVRMKSACAPTVDLCHYLRRRASDLDACIQAASNTATTAYRCPDIS